MRILVAMVERGATTVKDSHVSVEKEHFYQPTLKLSGGAPPAQASQ